jgi:hypothetical protein
MITGGPGRCTGLGSAGESATTKCSPAKSNVSPSGVPQSPVTTASDSSNRSNRSRVPGNGMAYAVCSASYHPAPMPSSTRPPLIWSTCATEIASGPGSRNVADVISVPSRIVEVSRASPASVSQASVGPGRPSVPIAR